VTLERLTRGDLIAWLAALALLFVTAMDWYSTKEGQEARRIEKLSQPQGAQGAEIERRVQSEARESAEDAEKNAWQAEAFVDRAILVLILGAVLAATAAALLRVAERPPAAALTASGLAAVLATLAAVLVAYRMFQKPGLDAAATIKPGAPIALGLLGLVALGAASTLRDVQRDKA
jgi:hypothetical protein